MTFYYDPKQPVFAGGFKWQATVFPAVVRTRECWMYVSFHVVFIILTKFFIDEETLSAKDFSWEAAALMQYFMTVFITFYHHECYKRYMHELYPSCCAIADSVVDFIQELNVIMHWDELSNYRVACTKYLLAIVYEMFMVVTGGKLSKEDWRELVKHGLLTPQEATLLARYTGHTATLVLASWTMVIVRDALRSDVMWDEVKPGSKLQAMGGAPASKRSAEAASQAFADAAEKAAPRISEYREWEEAIARNEESGGHTRQSWLKWESEANDLDVRGVPTTLSAEYVAGEEIGSKLEYETRQEWTNAQLWRASQWKENPRVKLTQLKKLEADLWHQALPSVITPVGGGPPLRELAFGEKVTVAATRNEQSFMVPITSEGGVDDENSFAKGLGKQALPIIGEIDLRTFSGWRRQGNLSVHIYMRLSRHLIKLVESCHDVGYLIAMPIPFAYFHLMNVTLVFNLLVYGIVLSLARSFYTIPVYALMVIGIMGVKMTSSALADPFGQDPVDFPVPEFINHAYDRAISQLLSFSSGDVRNELFYRCGCVEYFNETANRGLRRPLAGDVVYDLEPNHSGGVFAWGRDPTVLKIPERLDAALHLEHGLIHRNMEVTELNLDEKDLEKKLDELNEHIMAEDAKTDQLRDTISYLRRVLERVNPDLILNDASAFRASAQMLQSGRHSQHSDGDQSLHYDKHPSN